MLILLLCALGAGEWKTLAPGVEHRTYTLEQKPTHGDGLLHVVRLDPQRAELTLKLASAQTDKQTRTTHDWCDKERLVVATNAGMFETDYLTHTGYLRSGTHENSGRWVSSYKSVLLFGRRKNDLAPALIFDRDVQTTPPLDAYEAVVQNLRLIKADASGAGQNVWPKNERRWSEAALAQTKSGALLFLFSRTPYSMREFNEKLLATDLGVVRAMHLEGGPEASLSIHVPGMHLDLAGSYETGFSENDKNREQWPIPNVLGVSMK